MSQTKPNSDSLPRSKPERTVFLSIESPLYRSYIEAAFRNAGKAAHLVGLDEIPSQVAGRKGGVLVAQSELRELDLLDLTKRLKGIFGREFSLLFLSSDYHTEDFAGVAVDRFLHFPCHSSTVLDAVEVLQDTTRRILLIDDSRLVHNSLGPPLRTTGFEVLAAFDGEEGLAMARSYRPDLIISDIEMPKMNGFEACAAIRATPECSGAYIIMSSTLGSAADQRRGFESGVDEYIQKPVVIEELLDRIDKALRSSLVCRENVIILERDEQVSRSIEKCLTKQGFFARRAASLGAVRRLMKRSGTALVVAEAEPAGGTILDLFREIRGLDAELRPDIVVLSSRDDSAEARMVRNAGAAAVLSKPFTMDSLIASVEKTLADRRARSFEVRNAFIKETFGRYLSNEIVENILDTPAGMKLGGERRTVTIMMSDLRGFTSLAEHLSPEQVIQILNNFLSRMTDIILRHEGTIDEFIGDAILVIFGAPVLREDDARRAVACGLEMQLAMPSINEWNESQGLPAIQMGIGINTGEVVVGNIGSEKRAKYGVVGTTVNLTSRVEAYTTGGQILISDTTFAAAGSDFRVDSSKKVHPKGATEPMMIYEIGGIGAPYDLALPIVADERTELSTPSPVKIRVIEGKDVSIDSQPAEIVELGLHSALISSNMALAPMANIAVRFLAGDGSEIPIDLYGKVREAAGRNRFLVTWTSIPESAAPLLREKMIAPAPQASQPPASSTSKRRGVKTRA